MIEIKDLHKSFGNNYVLRGVNLTIESGRTIAIIGSSGCGKSVLLKHIIGLLKPDKGQVIIDGNDVTKMSEKEIYQIRQKFGFLFQGAALFDSMTVGENVGLGLMENTRKKEKDINKIVAEKLEMVKLPGIQNLKPSELSGGMKKRVGLARALATNPKYILYDEPTTGLDPITSDSIDELIDELANELKVTSIVVTHDIFSVNRVAKQVAMMHEGKIHWQGTAEQLKVTQDANVREFLDRTDMTKAFRTI